jgi:hypothetical protein
LHKLLALVEHQVVLLVAHLAQQLVAQRVLEPQVRLVPQQQVPQQA